MLPTGTANWITIENITWPCVDTNLFTSVGNFSHKSAKRSSERYYLHENTNLYPTYGHGMCCLSK